MEFEVPDRFVAWGVVQGAPFAVVGSSGEVVGEEVGMLGHTGVSRDFPDL